MRRLDLESENIESIWLEIKLPSSRPFLICYTYRYRPLSAKVDWLQSYNEFKEIIVLGDFGYDLIKFNPSSQKWLKIMETLTFSQLVKSPNRVTDKSAKLTDHVFSNIDSNISEINIPRWSISDHYPVTITRTCKHVKQQCHNFITYRSMLNFEVETFLEDLNTQPLTLVYSFDDPDESYCLVFVSFYLCT